MLIEDQSTKCPNCKHPLTWLSHVKRCPQPEAIHEFNFRCDSCNREFQFKEGQLHEKAHERNLGREDEVARHSELEIGINRRCPDCGGRIKNRYGHALRLSLNESLCTCLQSLTKSSRFLCVKLRKTIAADMNSALRKNVVEESPHQSGNTATSNVGRKATPAVTRRMILAISIGTSLQK
jgi:DNA-directed RNA polymerase subunit RPC12/RpoP